MPNDSKNRVLARYLGKEPVIKTAAFPPFSKNGPPELPEGQNSSKRNIPKDHPYDPRSMKPLAKSLWAASVSLGHALTAYRHLSRLKSGTISPDGMLGGRGYVMGVPDIRKKLYDACEALSAITDTLHDEITAPHWKPKLAQLDESDAEDVERFIEESQEILANPEEEAEEEEKEIEDSTGPKKEEKSFKDENASEIPGGGSDNPPKPITLKQANSSIPVGTLPGGPRIVHLDRCEEDPNPPDAYPSDDWGTPGEKEYLYPTPWSGAGPKSAQSAVPDGVTEDTPTEAWDFGIGYGAKGQGAGHYENPTEDGKGVWGPHSGIPGSPPSSSGDTTPALDLQVKDHLAGDTLPGDLDTPVARSDYYRGDRGNLINTQSVLPGEASPREEMSPANTNTTDYTSEDVETPYVRYDYTTPNFRRDPLHNWPQKLEQE